VSSDLEQKVVFFGCLIVAIILHEISHGIVALWFGDDTAKRAGRLTLNPLPHIDPFGSVILPVMGVLAGGIAFGYAKPVPVNPAKLRKPREHMLLVGLAGPGANYALMIVSAVAARVAFGNTTVPSGTVYLTDFALPLQILFWFALANLLLGTFNLLPIPPLDGSSLIERLLPREWLPGWYRIRPYGFLVLLVLLFAGVFARVFVPLQETLIRFIFQ
jgi:Zn-dependent protease